MDKLEEHSSGFADEVGKFVSSQKKKVLLGSKFPPLTIPRFVFVSFWRFEVLTFSGFLQVLRGSGSRRNGY